MTASAGVPRYQQVKDYVCERIEAGIWGPDQRVPSEHDLVGILGISRMTVNRALRELTAAGRLRRVRGLGTFVADPRPQAALLEIRNIADEIRARGHGHACDVKALEAVPAADEISAWLDVAPGTTVFHSVLVHREDGVPVQLEDRYVNPAAAPDYMAIDFSRTTPNEYLMRAAPLGAVEHVVDAVRPDAHTRALLEIDADEPCLLLHRRTWSGGRVASRVWLTHPGSRYRLGARFTLEPTGNRAAPAPSTPQETMATS